MNGDSNIDVLKLNSGEISQEVLSIGIYDQQGQLVNNDFKSEAVLYTNDVDNLQIVGNTKVVANLGIFHFKNIKYLAQPNYNSSILISSNVINKAACYQVTGSQCSDLQLNVNFRACKMGEVLLNNVCEPCAKGYYSFSTEDKLCQKCVSNLICNGKNLTAVYPGFWRSSPTSLKIFQCPKQDSCQGGIDSKCQLGYKGRMCNECNRNAPDGKIYGKSGAFTCQVCPNIGVQIVQILAVLTGIIVYIIILLNSVLQNPKRNKPQTVLIRIITNYFQAIMIVKEFDLAWPKQVSEMLQVFSVVSSSQEMIISLDCFLSNSYLEQSINFLPTFYLKVLLFGISPIVFGFLSCLVWYMIQVLLKRLKNQDIDVNLNIQATCFIIIYISYPTITTMAFSLFECFQIENDKYYLRKDFSIQCWTQQHMKMALSIGLPFIVVWVIGFPSFIMYKLYQSKKNLNKLDFISRYGLFFVGLNNDSYFWEVTIQNGRKILFIFYNSFLSSQMSNIKALLAILTLFLQLQILARLNPFIDPRFNQVDIQAQYAAISILFCGMYFVQEQVQKNNNALLILFIIVLCFNVLFLTLWLFRFTSVLLRINIDKFRQYQICTCLQHVKMLSYEEDLDFFIKKKNELESISTERRQFDIQNKRIVKFDMSTSLPNNSFNNNHDLQNLSITSQRNDSKIKRDHKKKRGLPKEKQYQEFKANPSQCAHSKRTNVDEISKIFKEDQSFGLPQSGGVARSYPQELTKIYNNPFPFL